MQHCLLVYKPAGGRNEFPAQRETEQRPGLVAAGSNNTEYLHEYFRLKRLKLMDH